MISTLNWNTTFGESKSILGRLILLYFSGKLICNTTKDDVHTSSRTNQKSSCTFWQFWSKISVDIINTARIQTQLSDKKYQVKILFVLTSEILIQSFLVNIFSRTATYTWFQALKNNCKNTLSSPAFVLIFFKNKTLNYNTKQDKQYTIV